MKYTVNRNTIQYQSEGMKQHGDDVVLLQHDIDLTAKTKWSDKGYTIEKLFEEKLYQAFEKKTHDLLIKQWKNSSLAIPEKFQTDQYHTIATTTEKHLAAVDQTKLLDVKKFPVPIELLENRISSICGETLMAKNPYDGQSVFHFRVIRPQQQDNNPLHRDVWLSDYKDCINLYIPIAGSNENSSLVLIPGSHHWSESKVERTISGALINGIKFNVPAVTEITGEHECVRPNPSFNEALVFSPYLIHGGSVNLNSNTTRISIEIRLWKK